MRTDNAPKFYATISPPNLHVLQLCPVINTFMYRWVLLSSQQ